MCKHIKKVWNSQPVIFAWNSLKHSFSLWVSLNTSQNSEEKACPRVSFLIKLQVSGGCFYCLNGASVVACRFSVKQVLLKISRNVKKTSILQGRRYIMVLNLWSKINELLIIAREQRPLSLDLHRWASQEALIFCEIATCDFDIYKI